MSQIVASQDPAAKCLFLVPAAPAWDQAMRHPWQVLLLGNDEPTQCMKPEQFPALGAEYKSAKGRKQSVSNLATAPGSLRKVPITASQAGMARHGSVTIAQGHGTAKCSGMPGFATETGCINLTLTPPQIVEWS
ncbi:chemotaxis protein CheB [Leisingera caerulea]|uniref:chemotaxis protein CheB n=1 Tax=Leisingera caerulea TaxID=506591 RepID=UPI0021A5D694|nr:chemotaxis protein CheB [Leisingera caerulea]UWQ49833.1 chemotaxis protein CheB [Leisingera caerulea]